MQICLLIKEKRKISKLTAKLTVMWYDKKPTSLQSNGMAAIPKKVLFLAVCLVGINFAHDQFYTRLLTRQISKF